MSVYASVSGVGDYGDDETLGAPWVYQGSHILPAEDDPRGGAIHLAEIPSHITRDGRDGQPEDGRPWPWLRLSVDAAGGDPTVLLSPAQARHHAGQVTAWADDADPRPTPDRLRERYVSLFRHAPGELRLGDEPPGPIADAVLAVRDEEMERLRARIAELEAGEAADREEILWLMNHNDRNCVVVLERDRLSLALEAADGLRAEVQRERDQHAAVLTDVLGRFTHDTDEQGAATGYQCLLTVPAAVFERWRAVVAPTVERPWWEQVREAQAAIERVRALADRWDSALAPARSQYSGPVRAALDYSEAEPADGAVS